MNFLFNIYYVVAFLSRELKSMWDYVFKPKEKKTFGSVLISSWYINKMQFVTHTNQCVTSVFVFPIWVYAFNFCLIYIQNWNAYSLIAIWKKKILISIIIIGSFTHKWQRSSLPKYYYTNRYYNHSSFLHWR